MRRAVSALCALGVFAAGPSALAACKLQRVAELKVAMEGARKLRPVVDARINGQPVRMMIDTGAGTTIVYPRAAERVKLEGSLHPVVMRSLGQPFAAVIAQARDLEFGARRWLRPQLLVVDGAAPGGADGLLGQDLLAGLDVEFDLAHGAVRLFAPQGCTDESLAYWTGGERAAELQLEKSGAAERPFAPIEVNGVVLHALFDSGSPTSSMTAEAARHAGVRPGDPGVASAGASYGIGPNALATWRGVFHTIKIGSEVLPDAAMDFVEKPNASADALIGADYFLTHRVLIARSQGRIYTTPVGRGGLWRAEPQDRPASAVSSQTAVAAGAVRP